MTKDPSLKEREQNLGTNNWLAPISSAVSNRPMLPIRLEALIIKDPSLGERECLLLLPEGRNTQPTALLLLTKVPRLPFHAIAYLEILNRYNQRHVYSFDLHNREMLL